MVGARVVRRTAGLASGYVLYASRVPPLLREQTIIMASRCSLVLSRDRGRQAVGVALLCPVSLLTHFALLRLNALQEPCKIREADDDYAQIIHRLFLHRREHQFVHSFATAVADVLEGPLH